MEVATISCAFPFPMRTLAPSTALRSKRATVSASSSSSSSSSPPPLSLKSSLSSTSLTPSYLGAGDFSGHKLRPAPLDPPSVKRNVIAMVIPYVRGTSWEQPPPDLASYLFKSRIVYLGMCLIPAVTELIMAEFLYLQYEDVEKPIFLYINSTGTTKGERKVGYENEAFAIYDAMCFVEAPIFTLCVGNAWGEAALLLAAGAKGNRSALPSSTIMIRQPIGRFQGQATAIEIARNEIKEMKQTLVGLYAKSTGKTEKEIEDDIRRPKYFSPSEAVDYGIIDKVLYNDKASKDRGIVSNLKTSNLV